MRAAVLLLLFATVVACAPLSNNNRTATISPLPTQTATSLSPSATFPPTATQTHTPTPAATEGLIDWRSIALPTVAITVPVQIELAPGVVLSDSAEINLILAIDELGRVYGSAEVADRDIAPVSAPTAEAAPTPVRVMAVATCDRTQIKRIGQHDVELCIERNGELLPERTLTREEIGLWFAELSISAEFLPHAYAMADCEAKAQWTAFWKDANGNRMVGPFAVNWRFFAAPAAEDVGRALDPFDDRDYWTMVKWLLERNGWSIWDCSKSVLGSANSGAFSAENVMIAHTETPAGVRPNVATPVTAVFSAENTVMPLPHAVGDCLDIGSNLWFFAAWGEAALAEDGTFSAEYLESLAPYRVLRLHDWINTNTNREVEWSDRRTVAGYAGVSQQGAQWEQIIELANLAQRDIWITSPTWASNDYFAQLARLFSAELDPQLNIYLEYSNEVWNTVFEQTAYVEASGGAAFQAARSEALWAAFSAEFESKRLHRVVAIRNGDAGRLAQLLDALNRSPDVVAINAYVGDGYLFDVETAAGHWRRGLDDEVRKMDQVEGLLPEDVQLVAYEGGQHWRGNSAEFAEWTQSADLYREMLETFAPYLDLFMHYTHSGVNSAENEQWGARRGDGLADFKYRALKEFDCS